VTPDEQLMQKIQTLYGQSIREAVRGTPFPASLFAALVANESSGDMGACRFEPSVFWQLAFVLIGRKADFGSISTSDLESYIPKTFAPRDAVQALLNLASSWGPTQIMGYQAIAGHFPISDLTVNPVKHFQHAVTQMLGFWRGFNLTRTDGRDPIWPGDADPFFRCWNTGRPNVATTDPKYVSNGIFRMQVYDGLEQHT
jgi:hypothetical protein